MTRTLTHIYTLYNTVHTNTPYLSDRGLFSCECGREGRVRDCGGDLTTVSAHGMQDATANGTHPQGGPIHTEYNGQVKGESQQYGVTKIDCSGACEIS